MAETFAKLTPEEVKSTLNSEYIPWIINHPFTHVKIQRKFNRALLANEGVLLHAYSEIIVNKPFANSYVLISD